MTPRVSQAHPVKFCALVFLLAALVSGCASKESLRGSITNAPAVGSPSFRQTMGNLLGIPFGTGNRITTLVNGDQIFPAMLSAIRGAEKSVTFETFVFEKGEVPRQFAEALAERARAGVKVHVILDAYGSRKARTYHRLLRESGVELERYHHIWYPDIRRYNHRTHRKLLVVDGKVGFIGGVGIADVWAGNADSPKHWRDCHYRIEGPAVAQLQGAFADNWLRTHHTLLMGPDYFPPLEPVGKIDGSAFYSSPRHGRYAVSLMYQMAIGASRESLKIENAYFIPDRRTIAALTDAARRGVKVQLILPGRHIDSKPVRRASRKRWPRLLEAGVEIYEFAPTMIHSKLMIVDGLFVSIGSANFDSRSLRLNDEANFNVLDAGFATEQTRLFEMDLKRSNQVTKENLKKKSLINLPVSTIERPLEPQL